MTTTQRPSFAPWDERDWPRVLSREEGTRRVAVFAAVERRQAALLDEWASVVSESQLQTILRDREGRARRGGDGELAIQTLLAAAADDAADAVQRSAARRAELEALLVQAGGLVGPDTLGMAGAGMGKGTG